jgi:DNA-binding response OmpR family regulator
MALARAGHNVITTTSGTEAVEIGRKTREPIDLLITDVVMPGMSGPEVAEQLKHYHPQMRPLFLSGYSSHAALPVADAGAFLQKPFTVDTLLARVRERLARHVE